MELAHLVMSTVGREPLFLERGARRLALRTLTRVAGARLWLFCLVDDHLHAVVRDATPTRLGGDLARAFAALPGAPELQASWAEPVDGREHLRRLLYYVLRQSEHHGLGPPATWEGSCFVDLVGARRLEGFGAEAWRVGLPREDVGIVWDAVCMERPRGVTADGYPLDALVAAAARALAADPELCGRFPEVVRARSAAARLARQAGFTSSQIASALSSTPQSVRRLAADADDEDVRAALRELAIDSARQRALVA